MVLSADVTPDVDPAPANRPAPGPSWPSRCRPRACWTRWRKSRSNGRVDAAAPAVAASQRPAGRDGVFDPTRAGRIGCAGHGRWLRARVHRPVPASMPKAAWAPCAEATGSGTMGAHARTGARAQGRGQQPGPGQAGGRQRRADAAARLAARDASGASGSRLLQRAAVRRARSALEARDRGTRARAASERSRPPDHPLGVRAAACVPARTAQAGYGDARRVPVRGRCGPSSAATSRPAPARCRPTLR